MEKDVIMKQYSNTNFKYMTNRLFSVLFVIIGGSMVYFANNLEQNSTSGITCLCAAGRLCYFRNRHNIQSLSDKTGWRTNGTAVFLADELLETNIDLSAFKFRMQHLTDNM